MTFEDIKYKHTLESKSVWQYKDDSMKLQTCASKPHSQNTAW